MTLVVSALQYNDTTVAARCNGHFVSRRRVLLCIDTDNSFVMIVVILLRKLLVR